MIYLPQLPCSMILHPFPLSPFSTNSVISRLLTFVITLHESLQHTNCCSQSWCSLLCRVTSIKNGCSSALRLTSLQAGGSQLLTGWWPSHANLLPFWLATDLLLLCNNLRPWGHLHLPCLHQGWLTTALDMDWFVCLHTFSRLATHSCDWLDRFFYSPDITSAQIQCKHHLLVWVMWSHVFHCCGTINLALTWWQYHFVQLSYCVTLPLLWLQCIYQALDSHLSVMIKLFPLLSNVPHCFNVHVDKHTPLLLSN
jgi:hypothetical protein